MNDRSPLAETPWISRSVPAAQRIMRSIRRDRIDYAQPGHSLSQTFRAAGPIMSVNADIAGPDIDDPFAADVRATLTLENASGDAVAQQLIEGPQLLWDSFGRMLELDPPAPAGEYRLVLRAERFAIGWHTADAAEPQEDDGVGAIGVDGRAFADENPVDGVRAIGVDTVPAANPVFRRSFVLDAPAAEATLCASVLGIGVIRINGTRVGDEALEPAVTDYDKTVLHRSWPVAHLLRSGENEILIDAGRERYSARGGDIWGWNLAPWNREPVAALRLDVALVGGGRTTIETDGSWSTAPGSVERELLFGGEDWVLRAEEPAWERASVVPAPAGTLREAQHPPVRAYPPIAPVVTETLADGSVVHDFGAVMTGRIRCTVTGPAGARVVVVSGEARDADGAVICDNMLAAGSAQQDTLRLERDAQGHRWEPQFGYRGFRWMHVRAEGGADVADVRAVPLFTPVETVGAFEAEEPLLTWIDSALARTFRNNLHGIPTDTPIYEKNGWTADAHLATEALLHHYDLRSSFGKWMDDHADAQREDGAIPHIVPTPGWGRDSDPAWSSSAVLIPWYLYMEYGDAVILERHAGMIRRYADGLVVRSGDGIWPDRSWGDWLAPGGHGVGPEGMAPIGTVMTVTALQHTARVLDAIGEPDAADYRAHAERIGRAYHQTWFDDVSGTYRVPGVGYRQSLNVLPLAFGVVPAEHLATVRAGLIDDIENRTAGHLDVGAVATRHLLPVLSDAGRDDLALTVLLQRDRPGWGVWFDDGESTLLESWDADARSRNHYFLGSVASWIQQRVGGLRATSPGWTTFEIAPVHDDRVRSASIRHRTPLGDAAVAWRRGPGGWSIDATVPEGATATVRVGADPIVLPAGVHRVRAAQT